MCVVCAWKMGRTVPGCRVKDGPLVSLRGIGVCSKRQRYHTRAYWLLEEVRPEGAGVEEMWEALLAR